MDFKVLLEPYKENGRTIEGILKWMISKGVARNFIDMAILRVFGDMENGTTFPNGNELDQFLLKVAKDFEKDDLAKQAKEIETFMTTFKQTAVEEYVRTHQASVWKRMKSVFKPT